jgi:GMP reductase
MDNVATPKMAIELTKHGMMTAMSKFTSFEEWNELISNVPHDNVIMPTIGIRDEREYDRWKEERHLIPRRPILVIDVPNGYTERFLNFVSKVRQENPRIFIIAGNVVSAEQVEELIVKGADCVKVGIGPGSACTTRIKSGVGRPQFSTIVECADAAHGKDGYIMADGGCTTPGDVAKAFGAGADFVMLGGMLAGHDECDGDIVTKCELDHYEKRNVGKPNEFGGISNSVKMEPIYVRTKYKQFWGMSSKKAMEKHYGKQDDYKASEGREVLVPYRGPVENTIQDILGGVRSACTYIGARKIKHMPKCATFYTVNRQVNNPYDS